MAFIQERNGHQRVLTIGAVAALHGAAIYALISGFGVAYIREVMPVFTARNIPQQLPPPPPQPQPSARPQQDSKITVSKPVFDLPVDDRILIAPLPIPAPPVPPQPMPTFEAAPPSPPPAFTPRDPRPRGRPAEWVNSNDYPARDLREGNQGTTRFSLLVGASGRIESCVVTTSSGFPGLDAATCKLVTARARFEPAIDENGQRVVGSFNSSIRWVIPAD